MGHRDELPTHAGLEKDPTLLENVISTVGKMWSTKEMQFKISSTSAERKGETSV